jgi:hypothetical protein
VKDVAAQGLHMELCPRPRRYESRSPVPQGLGDRVEGERWSGRKRRPVEGFAMTDGGQRLWPPRP